MRRPEGCLNIPFFSRVLRLGSIVESTILAPGTSSLAPGSFTHLFAPGAILHEDAQTAARKGMSYTTPNSGPRWAWFERKELNLSPKKGGEIS